MSDGEGDELSDGEGLWDGRALLLSVGEGDVDGCSDNAARQIWLASPTAVVAVDNASVNACWAALTACCLAATSAAVGSVGGALGELVGVGVGDLVGVGFDDRVGDGLELERLGVRLVEDRLDDELSDDRFADELLDEELFAADVPADADALSEALADAEALAEAASSAACSACSRVSRAAARVASAWVTASFSAPVPIVARTSPALTVSPTFTLTEVTVPAAGNDTSAFFTRASVPVPDRVWLIDPVVAVVVT